MPVPRMMTDERLREVMGLYGARLVELVAEDEQSAANIAKLTAMLPAMNAMLDDCVRISQSVGATSTRVEVSIATESIVTIREMFMRWYGFVQGSMWVCGIYTLEELKEHNRMKKEEPRSKLIIPSHLLN